jgi:hypothetical protein
LLVGSAEIVETGQLRMPFLIAAPTMRVPSGALGTATFDSFRRGWAALSSRHYDFTVGSGARHPPPQEESLFKAHSFR